MFRMKADYASMKSKYEHDLKAAERAQAAAQAASVAYSGVSQSQVPVPVTHEQAQAPGLQNGNGIHAMQIVESTTSSTSSTPTPPPDHDIDSFSAHEMKSNIPELFSKIMSKHASLAQEVLELKVLCMGSPGKSKDAKRGRVASFDLTSAALPEPSLNINSHALQSSAVRTQTPTLSTKLERYVRDGPGKDESRGIYHLS